MSEDDFSLYFSQLVNFLHDGLLPAGRTATFRSVADALGILTEHMLEIVKAVGRVRRIAFPVHRIVPNGGWFSNQHPEHLIESLKAEGLRIVQTREGRRCIRDFKDYWAAGEPATA